MSYNIILNSDNVSNNLNSQFKYNFINGNFTIKEGAELTVSEIQIPYSWFNITQLYNNNKLNLIDWKGTTYNITFPDGFYLVSDINKYLETFCINNGLYLINDAGKYIYYFNFLSNSTYYRNQFLFYPVPVSLPSGWVQPSNFVGFPTIATCPRIVILDNDFVKYSGFNAGTYGGGSIDLSILSQSVPLGSNANSIIVRCNLISNPVGFPSDILDTFAIDGTFGSNINYLPKFEKWVKVKSGTYSNLIITLEDQNYNQLICNDPNTTISLLLKQ